MRAKLWESGFCQPSVAARFILKRLDILQEFLCLGDFLRPSFGLIRFAAYGFV